MSENTQKHTPGPWVFYADIPSTDPNWHIVTTADKMRVLANVHIEPGNAMDEANARLMAAAPDLLEALEAVYEWQAGSTVLPTEIWERLRTAIAKATASEAK